MSFRLVPNSVTLNDLDDDISLLTHDRRKCYNNVKHCKPNTVNEKNQIKEIKLNFVVYGRYIALFH